MLSEEAFNAARIAITSFGVFFHEIIKEIGVDRTLELSLKPFERFVLEERVPTFQSSNPPIFPYIPGASRHRP